MRVIAKAMLRQFWEQHRDAEQALKSWHQEMVSENYRNPNALKRDYPSASLLGDGRVVFNIKGNKYRLIVRIHYAAQICYTRFVGTHAEYDAVDANAV